jgi:antitoxin (DNA-binding transcriptional repressor) of toxin-antitoxin stability system
MNINGLINKVVGMFMRRAANKGIDHVARKGKPVAQMTPMERTQAQKAREMTKRARKAASITRRLGR